MEWLFLWGSVSGNVMSLYHQMPLSQFPLGNLCAKPCIPPSFPPHRKLREWAKGSDGPLVGSALPCSMVTILRGPWPGVDHYPSCLRGSSEGRPRSPWSRRISSDGNKHHPFGTAFYSCKHFHTYYSIGNSQLCKEGILISSPFARWVNWDSERLNLLSRITQLLRSRTGTQIQMVPIDTESHKIQKEED